MTLASAGWAQHRQWGLWGCHKAWDHLGWLQSRVDPVLCKCGVVSFQWAADVSDLGMQWREDLGLLFLLWSVTKGLCWYKSIDLFRIYNLKIDGRISLAAFVFLVTWLLDVMLVTESWKRTQGAWPLNSFTFGLPLCTGFLLPSKKSGRKTFLAWLWH